MTPRHIDAIHIDSFRGIKNLHLEELAPINILTGDNNSGKTSVLEVIESLEAPGNIKKLWFRIDYLLMKRNIIIR